MRITVRNLLIYVACVGLALGQARLPVFVGFGCLFVEIALLAFLVPWYRSLWLSGGIFFGLMLGVFACAMAIRRSDINPASFPDAATLQAAVAGRLAYIERIGPYCFQVGALAGGTLGLILGQLRSPSGRRTSAAPIASDLR